MSQRRPSSTKEKKPPQEPRPSASILLISPANQVLLLHRVHTSSSFASAHVFPGGNLDEFHDGAVPSRDARERHVDGPAYRLGAIRECFEETGILLATEKESGGVASLIDVPFQEREAGRKLVHGNKVRFADWVDGLRGSPDVGRLVPFTRWITPATNPKRFTTQMYVYMLPHTASTGTEASQQELIVPTPDGGVEHTAARFDDASAWLAKANRGEIILFPPQYYLLALLSRFLTGAGPAARDPAPHFQAQRERLVAFLAATPTTNPTNGAAHPTSSIPWSEKVISPYNLFVRGSDGRAVLGLDKPSPELKGSDRGGDWERVVLVKFMKEGPRQVEVRDRDDALREERDWKEKAGYKL